MSSLEQSSRACPALELVQVLASCGNAGPAGSWTLLAEVWSVSGPRCLFCKLGAQGGMTAFQGPVQGPRLARGGTRKLRSDGRGGAPGGVALARGAGIPDCLKLSHPIKKEAK